MRKFDLQKSMRYQGELVHAGVYRVPNDMTQEAAERARGDGLGDWLPEEKPKPAKAGTGKSKGLAPENKVMEAPATKAATFPTTDKAEGLD